MDALYILGNGSKFNNAELKFSLRTLEKFVDVDRVIVVGENPGFLNDNVDFYRLPEANGNKEFRIAAKIEWACKKDVVTGDFFFLNDDFFFTQPIDPATFPNYCKGDLPTKTPQSNYQKSLFNTHNYLKSQAKGTLHFDVHTPIVYNAKKFMELAHVWNQSQKLANGFVVKSIYANWYNLEPTPYKDCKLNRLKLPHDFNRAHATPVFSCSDIGFVRGVAAYLQTAYPIPSKFEINHQLKPA